MIRVNEGAERRQKEGENIEGSAIYVHEGAESKNVWINIRHVLFFQNVYHRLIFINIFEVFEFPQSTQVRHKLLDLRIA